MEVKARLVDDEMGFEITSDGRIVERKMQSPVEQRSSIEQRNLDKEDAGETLESRSRNYLQRSRISKLYWRFGIARRMHI